MQIESRGCSAVASLQSPLHARNEDRFRLLTRDVPIVEQSDRGQIFAVFDGMGSKRYSAEASQQMCDALVDFYKNPEQYPFNQESFQHLLLEHNINIYNWGREEDTNQRLGGCAGTVAWFHQDLVSIFHVGDTAALLISDQDTTQVTSFHKDQNGLITRFFGMGEKLNIEHTSWDITNYSHLLLLTDGVNQVLDNDYLASIVNKNDLNIRGAVSEIVDTAKSRGSTDDITALLIDLIELE